MPGRTTLSNRPKQSGIYIKLRQIPQRLGTLGMCLRKPTCLAQLELRRTILEETNLSAPTRL